MIKIHPFIRIYYNLQKRSSWETIKLENSILIAHSCPHKTAFRETIYSLKLASSNGTCENCKEKIPGGILLLLKLFNT